MTLTVQSLIEGQRRKLGARKHLLLPKAIEAKLPALYATEDIPTADKKIIVKFFTPDSSWTWWVVEGSRDEDGDMRFFCLVEGLVTEWGYTMLSELETTKGPMGLSIERDKWFDNKYIRDVT